MLSEVQLIAPCGMNCGICMAYLRTKNHCPGCRANDSLKRPTCVRCYMYRCVKNKKIQPPFCYNCDIYPCPKLKHLDKRYRTRYFMSMLENLDYIKIHGLSEFVTKEKLRWQCPKCGGVTCVHRWTCSQCGEKIDR
jgi:hypothetical protein